MGKWISLNEFMQKFKVGYEVALQMLESGQYQYKKTDGGRYKILVDNDSVPIEEYKKVLARAITAETKLANAIAIMR